MKKRFLIMAVLLSLCTAFVSADKVLWGSNYDVGNVVAGVDAAFEVGANIEVSVYPSVELILLEPVFEDAAPLNIGAKAYGRFGIALMSPGFDAGIGLAGTAHLGFADLDIPEAEGVFDPIDLFLEIGVCFDILRTSTYPIGLILNSGLDYWMSEDFAVGLKYTSWNSYSGGAVGLLLKFSDRSSAEKAAEKAIAD
jgi:hypothetical protein